MSLQPEAWQNFLDSPCWKRVREEVLAAIEVVTNNIVSNDVLHSEGRDNFPEVKFERGKYFALQHFLDIPNILLEQATIGDKDVGSIGKGIGEGTGGSGRGDPSGGGLRSSKA